MKNPTFLIILLSVALVVVAYLWIRATTSTEAASDEATVHTSAIDNIMTRTSVRAYTDQEIESGKIDTLLRAAMAAPSAGNKQPWRFVVVNDRAILDTIGTNFQTMTMAKHAPLAIIMCGDLTATFEGEGVEYWVEDVSAASENLLLAAHALGMGAVWCGIYPLSERVQKFSEMLSLPENIVPMACICIGYPAKDSTPKDKWKPEHIRYNTWSDSTGYTTPNP